MTPNLTMAHLSDHLLGVALVFYALAMLGYAAEFAFSREGRAADRASVPSQSTAPSQSTVAAATAAVPAARSRMLVGAGLPDAEAVGTVSGDAAERVDPGTAALAAAAARAAAARAAAAGANDGSDAPVDGSSSGFRSARRFGLFGVIATGIGWATHLGSVISRGFAAHRVPWGNMYEFSSMITLIAVTVFLVLLTRANVRWLGVFVMVPVVLYLGFASTVLYVAAGPLVPALNSYWLKIHVVAAILSSGIFLVSAVITVLYLFKDRWENQLAAVAAGTAAPSGAIRKRGGIMMKLPPAASLDRMSYRVIAFAFPVWTFAIIAGAIWAEAAWGRYWGWDPKETWSFITWVIYAAYLHARSTAGWKGRRAAAISLLAFTALFVDYYIVNLIVSGLHSYAGVKS
ncbi:MAG: c-type cytochrome biogenesis protein CcsB [Frankia sp.]